MTRKSFRLCGAIIAATAMAGCTDDPTANLRQGVASVSTSLSYVEILVGDSVVLTAQTRDLQGNALPELPAITAVDIAVASVNIDEQISGKPSPETQFSILANGFGTTTVTASGGGQSREITVQTWPASVLVTAAELGGQVVSGSIVQLTGTPVGTDGAAITGPESIVVSFSTGDADKADIDAGTGLATAKSIGLATFSAVTNTDQVATGQGSFEVIAQAFAGVPSATQATGGQLVTVTQAAGAPAFDANTGVTFIPDDATIDSTGATITANTGTTLTFANPQSTSGSIPGTIVLHNVGPADVSQSFAFEVVGPIVFDGTFSSAAVSTFDTLVIYSGTAIPWDGDEEFTIGGVDDMPILGQSADSVAIWITATSGRVDGAAEIIIDNQGVTQIQGISSGVVDITNYVNYDDGTDALDVSAGPFPLTVYSLFDATSGDDHFSFTNPNGGYTVTVAWDNSADMDILWEDGNGACCYFNFDGAGSSNPEVSSSPALVTGDLPGDIVVLRVNAYDLNGNGPTIVTTTITSP